MEKEWSFPLPPQVEAVLERLERAGYPAYAVGGCVRDVLRGETVHDWDLCSAASPQQVMELFADGRVLPTGIRHGTVTLLRQGEAFEVTMFRREGHYDGRRPGIVLPAGTIQEDLARRDFTVNAMAYSPYRGFEDPCGGRRDLEAGLLRAVGEPEERFREDALRILRGLRFSACFGYKIEEKTADAMVSQASGLGKLSGERVWQELWKLLAGDFAGEVLVRGQEILRRLRPGWESLNLSAEDGLLFRQMGGPWGRLALLLSRLEEPEAALLELRCPAEGKKRVARLLRQGKSVGHGPFPAWLGEFPRELRREDARSALILSGNQEKMGEMAEILDSGLPLTVGELSINGAQLQQLGVPPGPALGLLLRELLECVWRGQADNEAGALAALAKELL